MKEHEEPSTYLAPIVRAHSAWLEARAREDEAKRAMARVIQTQLAAGVTKRAVCSELGIARTTLDAWLRGLDSCESEGAH